MSKEQISKPRSQPVKPDQETPDTTHEPQLTLPVPGIPPTAQQVVQLQRVIGNRAVTQLFGAKSTAPKPAIQRDTGDDEEVKEDNPLAELQSAEPAVDGKSDTPPTSGGDEEPPPAGWGSDGNPLGGGTGSTAPPPPDQTAGAQPIEAKAAATENEVEPPPTGWTADGKRENGEETEIEEDIYAGLPAIPPLSDIMLEDDPSIAATPEGLTLPPIEGDFGGDNIVARFAAELSIPWGDYLARLEHSELTAIAKRKSKGKKSEPPPQFDAARIPFWQANRLAWLANDFALTMSGATNRFKGNWFKRAKKMLAAPNAPKSTGKNPPPPVDPTVAAQEERDRLLAAREFLWNAVEGVKRGWMVGRREYILFEIGKQKGVSTLGDFAPPRVLTDAERVHIPDAFHPDDNAPPVAPEVVNFLKELRAAYGDFKAENYSGHGGGAWDDAGFSLDLYLTGGKDKKDGRGFWIPQYAVEFMLALHDVVEKLGGTWRVLYNDYSVAKTVNEATGKKNIIFMGGHKEGKKLNWHGPAPMVLHFHLDIMVPALKPEEVAALQKEEAAAVAAKEAARIAAAEQKEAAKKKKEEEQQKRAEMKRLAAENRKNRSKNTKK